MFTLGILTVSDRGSRGEREDESGKVIGEILAPLEACLVEYEIVPDEREVISGRLEEWVDRGGIDLIVTTGGTGLSPRDVTPEATLAVVDRAYLLFEGKVLTEGKSSFLINDKQSRELYLGEKFSM